MSALVGSSFGCADPAAWYNTPQKSRSGLSCSKNSLSYDYLLNTDGKQEAIL